MGEGPRYHRDSMSDDADTPRPGGQFLVYQTQDGN